MCLFSYKFEFSKKMKFTKVRARTELRTYYEEFLRARTYPYVIGIPIQYDSVRSREGYKSQGRSPRSVASLLLFNNYLAG